MLCSDLDGTLLGNPIACSRFKKAWGFLRPSRRPVLVYSSGRLVDDLARFIADGTLPSADYYIGGVGTQIFDARRGRLLDEFSAHLAGDWDRSRVMQVVDAFPGTRRQPEEFQHFFKCSWFLDSASDQTINDLEDRLSVEHLRVKVVYSSSRDLDVLPCRATKGGALLWLTVKLGIPMETVLVAGDTGNDVSMFQQPGVNGIVVENAQPELIRATAHLGVFRSKYAFADGVVDGLCHYGVMPHLET